MYKLLLKIIKYWKHGVSYGLKLSKSIACPINFHIEITNICNLRCIYCPQSQVKEHFNIIGKGKMDYKTYTSILNKLLASWKLKEIVLTRDGEPLVHPDLHRFIQYASEKKLLVTISSNGTYFVKSRVKQLIDSGLTQVKGDFCYDKEKYEKLRTGAKWYKVLQGYKNLLEYAVSNNKRFNLVLTDLNTYDLNKDKDIKNSVNKMYELFPYPKHVIQIYPAVIHNALNNSLVRLSASENLVSKKYNLCHHPWVEMVIDYKGNVVACCRDLRSEYIVGNILHCNDIKKEIWNGERMIYLRRNLAKRKPEKITICKKCDIPYGISYAGRGIFNKIKKFLFN